MSKIINNKRSACMFCGSRDCNGWDCYDAIDNPLEFDSFQPNEVDTTPIGVCAWEPGVYGKLGTIHVARTPDGNMEECCTFG